mgnify:CR=1 FL=1
MNDRALGLLGIARRASALSLGHDAALSSVKEGRASVCILASDSSERLKDEFISLCEKTGGKTPALTLGCTMNDLGTAVLTVNDGGFARKITELIREGK